MESGADRASELRALSGSVSTARRRQRNLNSLAWGVLVAACLLSLWTGATAWRQARDHARAQFDARADAIATAVSTHMNAYEDTVRAAAAVLEGRQDIEQDSFYAFVEKLLRRSIVEDNLFVASVVSGHPMAMSERTMQRHFLKTTGVTYKTFTQIERAQKALALLQQGRPAADLRIELWMIREDGEKLIKTVRTNVDGRTDAPLLDASAIAVGTYELLFFVGDYFAGTDVAENEPRFLDIVPVRFGIADAGASYHVPLLVSPWSYTTYRGS